MTKAKFLQMLKRELYQLSDEEREEILYDFKEHFAAGLAEGKREADIATDLGDPHMIAKELLLDYDISQDEMRDSEPNSVHITAVTFGLIVFNLLFVFGPIIGVFGLYIGLSVTAITLIFSPLLWLVSLLFNPVNLLPAFFASVSLCGLGLILTVGLYYFGKFLYKWLVKYIKFNVRIVKGEKTA